jgi:hypothetical protein
MNTYLLLLLELLLSVIASLSVLAILANPLIRTLARICPDEDSAGFWLRYAQVMLVIAPLILVLLMDLFSRYATPHDSLRMALLAALGGLLAGLYLIGSRLGEFIQAPARKGAGK